MQFCPVVFARDVCIADGLVHVGHDDEETDFAKHGASAFLLCPVVRTIGGLSLSRLVLAMGLR